MEADSPGAKAGLKVGDVITEINGKKVTDAGQLQMEVGEMKPGTQIALQVVRDGKSLPSPSRWEAWAAATRWQRKLRERSRQTALGCGNRRSDAGSARAIAGARRPAWSGDRAGAAGQSLG